MTSVLAATQVSIAQLKQHYGLERSQANDFFAEWQQDLGVPSETERYELDRIQHQCLRLIEAAPLLKNTVKLVVLSPLLNLAGFYDAPFQIRSEVGVSVVTADEGMEIRGQIDVLVLQERLWILAVEAKHRAIDLSPAIAQALAYMLATPTRDRPTFALLTNGSGFLFLKLVQTPTCQYANSRLFSLLNPGNELATVLPILQKLGQLVQDEEEDCSL